MECSAGQYWLDSAKSCVDCPKDSYQDELAQSECKSCPDNTYSDDEGAAFSTTCKCKYKNIPTFVVCYSHLLFFLGSLYCKWTILFVAVKNKSSLKST